MSAMGAPWRWLVVIASACGGSAPATVPISNTTPGVTADDPRAARALVDAAAAALSAGDVDGLLRLAAPDVVYGQLFRCEAADRGPAGAERQLRDLFEHAVENVRGAKVEVVAFEPAHDWIRTVSSGEELDDCVASERLRLHHATVQLRIQRAGRPAERPEVQLELAEAAGRWYLKQMPTRLSRDVFSRMVERYEQFSTRMCACADKACADQVNDDFTHWGMEMAKRAGDDDADAKPDPELVKRTTEAATRYSECYTKLAIAAQMAQPPQPAQP